MSDFWYGKTVAVTGGCGFLGSHVVDELAARGCRRILVYDDLSRGSLENVWKHINAGIVDHYSHDLAAVVPVFPPRLDAVIHMAALVASISYNAAHHWEMCTRNMRINLSVAEAVKVARPTMWVACSTACVYPSTAPVPTPESAADFCDPEPTNHGYGVSKWALEQMAKYLYREHGIPAVVTRFNNALGLRDYYDVETSHVAPALIKRVCDGEDPIVVWGTGTQSRVLVDARDIARALVDLAETPSAHDAQAVNIGHENEVTIAELARMICQIAGRPEARIIFDTSKPDGYPRRAADTTRLRGLVGWVPDTPLVETLTEMIADYRERLQ